jgi:hypothetical protein
VFKKPKRPILNTLNSSCNFNKDWVLRCHSVKRVSKLLLPESNAYIRRTKNETYLFGNEIKSIIPHCDCTTCSTHDIWPHGKCKRLSLIKQTTKSVFRFILSRRTWGHLKGWFNFYKHINTRLSIQCCYYEHSKKKEQHIYVPLDAAHQSLPT